MRYTKAHKENSRLRILKSAARAFRKKGVDGVGVADIMKDARLTHGGFYSHFASKEELVAETFSLSLHVSYLAELYREHKPSTVRDVALIYLTTRHRDHPGEGCPAAALAGEMHRRPRPTKKKFSSKVQLMLEVIEIALPAEVSSKDRPKRAMAIFSAMMGAMQLSRATDDPKLSRSFLDAGIEAACELAGEAGLHS